MSTTGATAASNCNRPCTGSNIPKCKAKQTFVSVYGQETQEARLLPASTKGRKHARIITCLALAFPWGQQTQQVLLVSAFQRGYASCGPYHSNNLHVRARCRASGFFAILLLHVTILKPYNRVDNMPSCWQHVSLKCSYDTLTQLQGKTSCRRCTLYQDGWGALSY